MDTDEILSIFDVVIILKSQQYMLIDRQILILSVFTIIGISCSPLNVKLSLEESPYFTDSNQLVAKSSTNAVRNPYSLRIMQQASDSICRVNGYVPRQLIPTNLYLCFTPSDSSDLALLENAGYDLFSFPLDDCEYTSPQYTNDSIPIIYSAIDYISVIPDVPHSILDTCYIPITDRFDYSRNASSLGDEEIEFNRCVEQLAYELAGVECAQAQSRSRYAPSGCIHVLTDSSTVAPLSDVKVYAHSFVKFRHTFTDKNGNFSIPADFITVPRIRLKAQTSFNDKVFDTGRYLGFIPTESDEIGQCAAFIDYTIADSSDFLNCAKTLHYLDAYRDSCQNSGFPPPPSALNIFIQEENPQFGAAAAPMLKHLSASSKQQLNLDSFLSCFISASLPLLTCSLLYQILSSVLPDIIIYKKDKAFDEIRFFHELTHSSHFTSCGGENWSYIISEICINYLQHEKDVYGDGCSDRPSQLFTELAESWAYARNAVKFGVNDATYRNQWFRHSSLTFMTLIQDRILSEEEISRCMSSDVLNMDDLCCKLCAEYPNRAKNIFDTFVMQDVLRHWTEWRILNSTDDRIRLGTSIDTLTTSVSADQGEFVVFSTVPGIAGFNDLTTNFSFFFPGKIDLYYGDNLIFSREGQIPIVRLRRPFFYIHEWENNLDRISSFPTKTRQIYTFNLQNQDF